ncbi:MAG: hypothetical protein MZU84_06915 [Sphingobacterium sp.]|nr:hypothetical protein [Sphingobacterium sp.]
MLVLLASAHFRLLRRQNPAERFDVQIDIQSLARSANVETVEFRFSGDRYTFAFREISATETDGVTFADASMDGVPMPLGTQAGAVEVRAEDPLKVTWHFRRTSVPTRLHGPLSGGGHHPQRRRRHAHLARHPGRCDLRSPTPRSF